MTQENNHTQANKQTTEAIEQEQPQIHHQTRRAADLALSKRTISPDSRRAILAGELGLEAAKELGRAGSPYGPVVRVNKNDRGRDCLCACGLRTRGGRFRTGHDQRLVTLAKRYVRGEATPNEEQMEYIEKSGKLERAKAQVAKEDQRKAEKAKMRDVKLSERAKPSAPGAAQPRSGL